MTPRSVVCLSTKTTAISHRLVIRALRRAEFRMRPAINIELGTILEESAGVRLEIGQMNQRPAGAVHEMVQDQAAIDWAGWGHPGNGVLGFHSKQQVGHGHAPSLVGAALKDSLSLSILRQGGTEGLIITLPYPFFCSSFRQGSDEAGDKRLGNHSWSHPVTLSKSNDSVEGIFDRQRGNTEQSVMDSPIIPSNGGDSPRPNI